MDTEGIFDGFGLSGKESALRSRKILEEILDNYDSFNISTIDSFINRILNPVCAQLGYHRISVEKIFKSS